MKKGTPVLEKFSYLKSTNVGYIDDLFTRYLDDPDAIDASWRYFFDGLELGQQVGAESDLSLINGHATSNGHDQSSSAPSTAQSKTVAVAPSSTSLDLGAEARVAELIERYRDLGRFLADINPLQAPPSTHPRLELSAFGLTNDDLERTFSAGKLIGIGPTKLRDIIAHLKATYCERIAVEVSHIQEPEARKWLVQKMEAAKNRENLDLATRRHILTRLTESETFERFLHTRYVAQKRFSIEGGEASIPALDCMIEIGAALGAKEFKLGMAHRGRLNVLANVFGKKPEMIFVEFEGTYKIDLAHGEGDVKYHKGYSADFTTRQGKQVHLSLSSNPSHLEFVNAIVEGEVRAKQERLADKDRTQVIPILIHGDAAFAGQGVCYETLNLSQLLGYGTGGTLHLVINNQVGFTTDPVDSRSTPYSTDLAKMLDSPIFHVNGDDPEAVWYVCKLATEYRQKFKADVFIDLVCYRKHGHNEGDEPSFTQPLLYKKIKSHPSPRETYAKRLADTNAIPETDSIALVEKVTEQLTQAQARARTENPQPHTSVFQGVWQNLRAPTEEDLFAPVSTQVESAKLLEIAEKINRLPEGFHVHPKLNRFFDARLKAVKEGKGIDWGNGEALAYATLLSEGHPVRLSGQDAERGTFTHRHSVLHDFETGEVYYPLNSMGNGQAHYDVFNSHLSETGVLGFEYGYSLAAPDTLTIWEAQFGDFANGAQVIIDQFIATAESKWQRMSGLVMLLPHGYEGQGPEHSSARLERFLNLCGKNNLIVANLTTPAQIFHALRRQVKRDFRKPLVIMSPKSLLRNPLAISSLEEFSQGGFQEVIDDPLTMSDLEAGRVNRVLICTGKVYYDLVTERSKRKRDDVAIVRLEQIHPWPAARLASVINRYRSAKDIMWVQEEPRNMGAWGFVFNTWAGGYDDFNQQVGKKGIRYAGRGIAAAPAVGSPKQHEVEQKGLVDQAFGE